MHDLFYLFQSLISSVKLLHFTTSSYAMHKNTDEFHKNLLDGFDRYMEAYIGLHPESKEELKNFNSNATIMTDYNRIDEISKALLLNLRKDNNSSMEAIADDIEENINKYKYLSTFQ